MCSLCSYNGCQTIASWRCRLNETLQLLLLISILILVAKAAGLVSTRIGQPAVLGELLAGLVLGPTVIDIFHRSAFSSPSMETMTLALGELGVIFLMFIAGLEINLDEMLRSGWVAILAGSLGVITPLILGTVVAVIFGYPILNSIFIGLILTATSVSISAQTLLELGVIGSREGLALLGAAVVDDVLGILLLSVFLALSQSAGGHAEEIAMVVLRMVVFFAVAIAFGVFVLPKMTRWVVRLPVSEGVIAFVVVVTLMYAWSAQEVGEVAAITGAFVAGVLFGRTTVKRPISEGMHTLTYAFFVPIFLISVGLRANARSIGPEGLVFAAAIILVAVVGKIIGCWFGARLARFTPRQAFRVGVGMISRGEVGLIIAAIGLQQALIDAQVYAIMILMVLVTTLLTPILLKRVFPHPVAHETDVVPLLHVTEKV